MNCVDRDCQATFCHSKVTVKYSSADIGIICSTDYIVACRANISIKAGIPRRGHDTDTDILARILADTSDTRDFLKFMWQAERHADILATILATMSAMMLMSLSTSWNASLMPSVWLLVFLFI